MFDRPTALRAALVFLFWAAFLGFIVWSCSPVFARDPGGVHADSPHKAWYQSQHNDIGQWCCDESDAHPYYGDYSFDPDGSVNVALDGAAHKLPGYMVLKGTNPTGHAVWWFVETTTYGHVDYCFAPGTLG